MTRKRYDEKDPDQREMRQKTQELRLQQAEADLRWVLSHPSGRRVMADIMRDAGLLEPSFVAGDALQTAFREGRRSVALQLRQIVGLTGQDIIAAILAEMVTPIDG